jgi:hypothetical protein
MQNELMNLSSFKTQFYNHKSANHGKKFWMLFLLKEEAEK